MKELWKRYVHWPLAVIVTFLLAAGAQVALANLTFTGTTISGNTSIIVDGSSTISIGTSTATAITIGNSNTTTSFFGTVAIGTTLPANAPTGTLAASVIYSPNGALNLMAFGAVGNNVTADSGAMTAAIAAAPAGGSVFIPAGTFLLPVGYTISKAIRFVGLSQAASILKVSGTSGNFISVTASGVSFENLAIDATGATGDGVNVASALSNIAFRSVTVKNAGNNCVTMSSNSNVLVDLSTFIGCGVVQFDYVGAATSSNVIITNSTFDGSAMTTSAHVSLFIQGSTGGNTSNIIIKNNTIKYPLRGATESDGLVVLTPDSATYPVSGVTSDGNYIGTVGSSSSASFSIELKGVTKLTAINNVVAEGFVGMLLDCVGTCTDNNGLINNNKVTSVLGLTGGIGISVAAGRYTVTNNIVSGYAAVTLSVSTGNGTVARHNDLSASVAQNIVQINCGSGSCTGIELTDNTITGVGGAVGVETQGNGTLTSAVIRGNHIAGTTTYGIYFNNSTHNSGNLVANNTFEALVGIPYLTVSKAGVTVIDENGSLMKTDRLLLTMA